jgi:benzoyl-CoA reductase/2-hydroxyglutaryl-CoA dehydratase subunit BcrC/BadD/HgdB
MPEISVRPILRKVSQDMNIPILECSFDEHTSHVGVATRLEAFVDILYERRRKKRA